MNNTTETIASPVAKVVTVWAAVGITTWADVASFLAACYSMLLISEWLYKRVIKPVLIKKGILK